MPSTLRFSPLSHRLGCNYRKETKTRVLSAFNAGQWWHRDIKPAHLKHTDGTDNVRTLQWARSLPAAEHSWLLPCTWCIPYITCNLWLPTATPLSLLRVMHIFPYHPCGHTTWTGDKTWQIVSETKKIKEIIWWGGKNITDFKDLILRCGCLSSVANPAVGSVSHSLKTCLSELLLLLLLLLLLSRFSCVRLCATP